MKQAGLGFRRAALHGPAAYLASLGASRDLAALLYAQLLDPDAEAAAGQLELDSLNANLPPLKKLTLSAALASKQKAPASALNTAGHEERLAGATLVEPWCFASWPRRPPAPRGATLG